MNIIIEKINERISRGKDSNKFIGFVEWSPMDSSNPLIPMKTDVQFDIRNNGKKIFYGTFMGLSECIDGDGF